MRRCLLNLVCSLDTFYILFTSFQGEGLGFGMRAVYIVVWFGLWVWEGCGACMGGGRMDYMLAYIHIYYGRLWI